MLQRIHVIVVFMIVALCCLWGNSYAVSEKEFFSEQDTDISMVEYILEGTDGTIQYAEDCYKKSFSEALYYLNKKNYDQAYHAGKFAWYCAVYERMLVEQKRIKGETLDDIANRSNENLNNMAQFFLWKDEKEFMNVYKRSMEILLYKKPSETPQNIIKISSDNRPNTINCPPQENGAALAKENLGEYEYSDGKILGTVSISDKGNSIYDISINIQSPDKSCSTSFEGIIFDNRTNPFIFNMCDRKTGEKFYVRKSKTDKFVLLEKENSYFKNCTNWKDKKITFLKVNEEHREGLNKVNEMIAFVKSLPAKKEKPSGKVFPIYTQDIEIWENANSSVVYFLSAKETKDKLKEFSEKINFKSWPKEKQ